MPFKYPLNSHFISEVVAFLRIPRQVRRAVYDEMFIASIGSLSFAILAGRNRDSVLNTFDDGTFNLLSSSFSDKVNDDGPLHYRALKAVFSAKSNREIVESSLRHFTIFDHSLRLFPYAKIEKVDLFPDLAKRPLSEGREVVVVVGTPIHLVDPSRTEHYHSFVRDLDPDLYIPHPAETAAPAINNTFANDREVARKLDECIAEEIIGVLVARGYRLVVHGFSSTVLLNVCGSVEARNHFISEPAPGLVALFQQFGIVSDKI